ncbi:hypothetical protein DL346_09265 [Paenibacillus montanisoli]|uniref:Uncharacterized protein n=2 Tax=Paenibacillus montanisoli TaxID=2081970 RepID=A0A328U2B5_9BACL|nr:hypothetical protein DL346_09265 [Paenibacillus montanisoli]
MSIIGGILLGAAHSIDYFASQETLSGKGIVFLAHIVLVFAFFGIHAAQADKNRVLGTLGLILGVIGSMIVTAIIFVEMASVTGVQTKQVLTASLNGPIQSYGPLLFVLGMILVSLSILRNKVLSYWGAALLLVGTVIFALGTIAGSGELLITMIGSIFKGIGFIVLGYQIGLTATHQQDNSASLN